MTLEVEREVPEVGMTSYRSRCSLNRVEKISVASAFEVRLKRDIAELVTEMPKILHQ